MKRLLLPIFIFVAVAAFLMGTASDADATFMLSLTDTTTDDSVVIADQGGNDSSVDMGVIVFIGGVGGFNINVTTGLSKPAVGPARLDLCSVNVSGGAGTLEIMLLDTDFFDGIEIAGVTLENAWGGTAAHEVTAQGFLDIYNRGDINEFNPEAEGVFQTYYQGPLGPGAFDSTVGGEEEIGSFTGPFSLTERVTITHTSRGQSTSFNKFLEATVYQVPDASVAFLLGSAFLLGFAVSRRREKENSC